MALWEYKVITSGKGGFATPALLESYLNQLGTDEWEIIEFRAQPDNPLAFHGLARRPTERDWTLEAAATAAAKVEADKLRAEFAAKFQAATTGTAGAASAADPGAPAAEAGEPARDDAFRPLRDTEHDLDPDALDDTAAEEVNEWPAEDQLPSFFEAIRPHMRRNQRGPGHSVSVDYLVKKFEMLEGDLMTALQECGFPIPEDEDEKPVHLEYDGDIYWLNVNRRGEIWINMREKPRPVFKVAKATPLAPETAGEKAETGEQKADSAAPDAVSGELRPESPAPRTDDRNRRRDERRQRGDGRGQPAQGREAKDAPSADQGGAKPELAAKAAPAPLPAGTELLDKLRPLMRRGRGGWSGSIGYLARAVRRSEADLSAALAALGLQLPAAGGEKPAPIEFGELSYWLNKDGRGGVWINVSERKPAESAERKAESPAQQPETGGQQPEAAESAKTPTSQSEPSLTTPGTPKIPTPATPSPESPAAVPVAAAPLAAVRLLMKPTKTGSYAGSTGFLAQALGKGEEEFIAALVGAGLKVPEKAREKPVFAEHAGEIFWFNKNAKGELWLNAKASKFASKKTGAADSAKDSDTAEKKADRGGRGRKKTTASE
jgi:hypothetical protein